MEEKLKSIESINPQDNSIQNISNMGANNINNEASKEKSENVVVKEEVGEKGTNIYEELPQVVVKFIFKGKTYIVTEFDMQFSQETDWKNIPSGDVYGGIITITINENPDNAITAWMMTSYQKNEGEIHFYKNEGKIDESALLKIHFEEAFCVNFRKIVNPLGAGLLTTLSISPKTVNFGNVSHRNRWK